MKVLHFSKTYYPDSYGGTEQFVYQLARGSAKLGVDVEVLSLSPDVNDETRFFENHLSHRVRRNIEIASTGVSLKAFSKFAKLAQQADVVHYHYPWPFQDVVHFATSFLKPTIVTYHSDIVRQKTLLKFYAPLMKHFLASVDCIVATSQNYLETSETLKNYRDKIRVIPIGLDPATYPTPDPILIEAWRRRVREPFFLFVGVLRYYKGLHILLDAIRGTGYPLVIVGAGPIEAELRVHAKRSGLANVHFLGQLSDLDKVALISMSFALVFPSHLRSEAFGISLLEGAMFGKPLVSSEIGTGTSYVNINGETGIVIRPNDAEALRNALTYLYENPGQAAKMGKNARLRYETHFTASLMADRYVELYSELIAAHKARLSVR